jgi:hypothetical protein
VAAAHGLAAAGVVGVGVGEDEVTDRRLLRQAKIGHRGQRAVRAGAGVDGDDSRARLDEREVAEVVAEGDVHVRCGVERARRGHPHPVPRGHRESREHRLPVRRGRAEPGPSQSLSRLLLPPEHQIGTGRALVRGAERRDRELVTDREHELPGRRSPGPLAQYPRQPAPPRTGPAPGSGPATGFPFLERLNLGRYSAL